MTLFLIIVALLCDASIFMHLYREKKRREMQRAFDRVSVSARFCGIALREVADTFRELAER